MSFNSMLLKVRNDDILSFKNNNSWLSNHPSSSAPMPESADTSRQPKGGHGITKPSKKELKQLICQTTRAEFTLSVSKQKRK